MSWRVTFEDAGGLKRSPSLRTRTDAMIFACDLERNAVFVQAIHSNGQSISKLGLEIWRRANDAMLKGRVSPRALSSHGSAPAKAGNFLEEEVRWKFAMNHKRDPFEKVLQDAGALHDGAIVDLE